MVRKALHGFRPSSPRLTATTSTCLIVFKKSVPNMLTALFCLLLFWYTSTPVSALYHNNRARSLCPNTCTTATVTVTVSNSSFQASCDTSTVRLPTTVTTSNGAADSSPTISVSRAGSILQSSAAAEANPVDPTAVRAAVNTSMKDSSGKCLTVDATAGDFRQNLIPITLKTCDGCRGQQWDMVTSGKHNNVPGQVLVVSSLTQGCLNFDPRRAIGDQVIMFSCGGRADGGKLPLVFQRLSCQCANRG